MKTRTRVILFVAVIFFFGILPQVRTGDKLDSLESELQEGEDERDDLVSVVERLVSDNEALRAQLEQNNIRPATPPVEERLEDENVDVPPPVVIGPTGSQLVAAVQTCFRQGFCVVPPGPEGPPGVQGPIGKDGPPGEDGEDGDDADPITSEQIMQGVADCVEAGACVLPEGPQGQPGPAPQEIRWSDGGFDYSCKDPEFDGVYDCTRTPVVVGPQT